MRTTCPELARAKVMEELQNGLLSLTGLPLQIGAGMSRRHDHGVRSNLSTCSRPRRLDDAYQLFASHLRSYWTFEMNGTADEGAPSAGSGWCGSGKPMLVGTGRASREFCDGQSVASPGRWPIHSRRNPSTSSWLAISETVSGGCFGGRCPSVFDGSRAGQSQQMLF